MLLRVRVPNEMQFGLGHLFWGRMYQIWKVEIGQVPCGRSGSSFSICFLMPCEGALWNTFGLGSFVWGSQMKCVPVRSFRLMVPDEIHSGQVVSFEGSHIKFGKFLPPGCLVHVCAAYFPFSPLFHHLIEDAVSRHVRVPNEICSGRVVSFEGGCIKFAKLWPHRCLMQVHATRFPFTPLWLHSVVRVVSRSARVPDETFSDRVISFEGGHIKFSNFWPHGCLVHVRAANFPYYPLFLHSIGCTMLSHVRVPNETRPSWFVSFQGGRIKFSKLWPREYIVHVCVNHLSFSPLYLHLVRHTMLCHVGVPDETRLGQVISFEGSHFKFAKFWLARCIVHIHAAYFSFPPLCLHSVRCVVLHLWGCPMKWIRFRSFFLRATISNLISCGRSGALCTFVPPIFHFLPCAFIRSGAPCHSVWGHPMKHVRVGSFFFREAVSNFLSCDYSGALCTFVQPIFFFLPCAFVWLGALYRVVWGHPMKHVRFGSFHLSVPDEIHSCQVISF